MSTLDMDMEQLCRLQTPAPLAADEQGRMMARSPAGRSRVPGMASRYGSAGLAAEGDTVVSAAAESSGLLRAAVLVLTAAAALNRLALSYYHPLERRCNYDFCSNSGPGNGGTSPPRA